MCGIAGFVQRAAAPGVLARQLRALAHRGPDAQGEREGARAGWRVALGCRRLALLDIPGGGQPMGDAAGGLLVFNGEIWNHRELRAELERGGRRFATRSDTEVVLQLLEERGEAGLAALDGMFALAFWDGRAGTLLLARDRVGIKPLSYAPLPGGGLAFASELTALLAHPDADRRLDGAAVRSLFAVDFVRPPLSVVRGAAKLAPGACVSWRDGVLDAPRRWVRRPAPSPVTDEREAASRLRAELEGAVERALVADVPVGVLLSGGIDSASVAALAAKRSARPPASFCVGFTDARFDERPAARETARLLGLEHHDAALAPAEAEALAREALDALDEPLADPSCVPMLALSRLAARHVKVVLGGDGADELWGGYPTVWAHRLAGAWGLLPAPLRDRAIAPAVARLSAGEGYQGLRWRLRRFVLGFADDAAARHRRWMAATDEARLSRLLPGVPAPPPPALPEPPLDDDPAAIGMALDLAEYLPGSVLAKVDRMSMACGLEVRPPFLADAVVDLARAVPASLKLRAGRRKRLVRLAMRDLLPPRVLARGKRGFAPPLAAWLRGPLRPLVEEALGDARLFDASGLERGACREMWEEHRAGRGDVARPLWSLVVLHRWLERARRA